MDDFIDDPVIAITVENSVCSRGEPPLHQSYDTLCQSYAAYCEDETPLFI